MTDQERFNKLQQTGIIKDFGAVMRGIADAALESAFGAEYIQLSDIHRKLVLQDCLEAGDEEHISIRQYLHRIGKGNLSSYAEVMSVRLKGGRE